MAAAPSVAVSSRVQRAAAFTRDTCASRAKHAATWKPEGLTIRQVLACLRRLQNDHHDAPITRARQPRGDGKFRGTLRDIERKVHLVRYEVDRPDFWLAHPNELFEFTSSVNESTQRLSTVRSFATFDASP